MLIYEFLTLQAAQQCLGAINVMASNFWKGAGFTVVNENGVDQLVGKRGGKDNPDAMKTSTWDVVKQSPDGTFYFTSLSNNPAFKDGTQQLIDAGFVFTEREFPEAWMPKGEVF